MHVQTFWAVNLNILSLEIFIKIWTEVTVSAQLQIVNWMTTDSSSQLVVPGTHTAGSKLRRQTPTTHMKNGFNSVIMQIIINPTNAPYASLF